VFKRKTAAEVRKEKRKGGPGGGEPSGGKGRKKKINRGNSRKKRASKTGLPEGKYKFRQSPGEGGLLGGESGEKSEGGGGD